MKKDSVKTENSRITKQKSDLFPELRKCQLFTIFYDNLHLYIYDNFVNGLKGKIRLLSKLLKVAHYLL